MQIEKQSPINAELESVTAPLHFKSGMLWALHKLKKKKRRHAGENLAACSVNSSTSIWLFFSLQTTDDILVASAECPSDDEDIDPCEPSSGGLG